ncbi:hypothetical protein EUTSA_v10027326mg [Eutrema salsugineum]|uniref:F-box domain-containing protein n=1 Tax=Eutrema salsugineum TaxID=72664 RepID=V4LT35_EUTSA|nr:putative F-box/kelch-repeat protein At4g35120 [Eutrema salsugineum]ESQ53775.1 hypothetical protein EUTSA_v10027326mg [Eutrema salsugineum]
MTLFKRTLVVATKVEQPPPPHKRKREKSPPPPPPPSFSLLPDDILVNCLARTSKSQYRSISLLSKTIRSLLFSPELYTVRSRIGNTEPCLYLCQELPTYDRLYIFDRTLTTDGWIKDEFSLSPITCPAFPSMSTTLAVGFEIYQMGGTTNAGLPSSAVRVLDCRTHTWRDAPEMTVPRKRAESAFIDGKIYVVGGTEESMNCAEVFDLKSQTWKPLPSPSGDAKVLLSRGELYATSRHKSYAYDSYLGRWKDSNQGRWNRLGSRAWCLVENVKFSVFGRKLMWFDSERRNWFIIQGLEDLHLKGVVSYPHTTIQLSYTGGNILLLWDEPRPLKFPVVGKKHQHTCKNKRIWCAEIKLEKHVGFSGLEIWGKIVRSSPVLSAPDSYKLLSCVTL